MAVHWRNWGRSASAVFADLVDTDDAEEISRLVVRAGREGYRVRPVGSSHSFSPVVAGDGIGVRAAQRPRLIRQDGSRVTVAAGTRLRDLPELLDPLGLALQCLGDIDAQTVAGAISTGTHGTGASFRGMSSQVAALRMVLADGSVVDCSEDLRPNLFAAARLGLGAFGIITEVTLSCVPAFALRADEHPEPLSAVLDDFRARMSAADHVEFHWFPHTDVALVKSHQRVPSDEGYQGLPRWRQVLDDEVLSNGAFFLTTAVGSLAPSVVPAVNRWSARLVADRRYSGRSQDVFVASRRVRFKEMEYAVPVTDLPEVLRSVRSLIERNDWRISFPIQVRVGAADDVWLSPAYDRDTAYLAVHRYAREPFADYFLAVEAVALEAGGRPHWGKLHTLGYERLAGLYPRLEEAARVRRAVDPEGLFGNEYLNRVLGPV